MMEYKSPNRVIKMNPRGASSQCPVCGGRLKHPTWRISSCKNRDQYYDRGRFASLAISLRGLVLCGDPFPESAVTSLPSMMDEYLYLRKQPELSETGSTKTAYAPNKGYALDCRTF